MALFALNPGLTAALCVDLVDTELASIEGGEVMTLSAVATANSSTEKSAADAKDGYLQDASGTLNNRIAATRADAAADFPLYLSDDGTSGYGTLFGQVIGTSAGLTITAADSGPNTAAASGKVTLWDKPGRYAITLDSCASDFVSSIGSTGLTPGEVIGFSNSTNIGRLSRTGCANLVTNSGVGFLVELQPRPGLVNTPLRLVGAAQTYDRVAIEFHAGHGLRTVS